MEDKSIIFPGIREMTGLNDGMNSREIRQMTGEAGWLFRVLRYQRSVLISLRTDGIAHVRIRAWL